MESNELIKILEAIARLSKEVSNLESRTQKKEMPPARSKELKELFTSLAKAQSEMKTAGLTKTNPFFKSRYSDMAEIVSASRPALTKNGLGVIQQIIPNEDGQNILHTVLTHSSGQWIESRMRIVPPKADVQSLGSYITYLKRYSYASLVGIVSSDEDDDAEIAVHNHRDNFKKGTQLNHKYNPKEHSFETISKDQLDEIHYELKNHTDLAEEIMDRMKIQSLSDVPKSKFLITIKRIREIIQLREGK